MPIEPEVLYIEMAVIGAMILDAKTKKPWGAQRARRWLQRSGQRGAPACVKRTGRWVTTLDLLRNTFPESYQRIQMELPDG